MSDIKGKVISASTAFNARFDKGVELSITDYKKIRNGYSVQFVINRLWLFGSFPQGDRMDWRTSTSTAS